MPGLGGSSTAGVGKDIVDYLTAVALHYNVTIHVTSGYRDAAGQGKAMFDNWIKLKRGAVYSKRALPEADRKTLDALYKTAKEDPSADAKAKTDAQAKFLKLASDKVGNKSMHTRGRATDVTQASVPSVVYAAIVRRMKEVKEGNRNDIYHFESSATIPPVTDAEKKLWGSGLALTHPAAYAGRDDFPCTSIA